MSYELMKPVTPFTIYITCIIILFICYILSLFTGIEKNPTILKIIIGVVVICACILIGISFKNSWCAEQCQVESCDNDNCGNSSDTRKYITIFGTIVTSILIIFIVLSPFEDTTVGKAVLGTCALISFGPLLLIAFNAFGFMCYCTVNSNSGTCDTNTCNALQNCTCIT